MDGLFIDYLPDSYCLENDMMYNRSVNKTL